MAALHKFKKWNLKPQLTADPALWRGMVIAIPLWETGNFPREIITGNEVSVFDSIWGIGPAGWCVESGGSDWWKETLRGFHGATEFTGVSFHKAASIGNNEGIFRADSTSGDPETQVRYDSSGYESGGTNLIKFGFSNGVDGTAGEAESNLQTTELQHVALRWRSGQAPELFVDGKPPQIAFSPQVITGAIDIDANGGPWDEWAIGRGGQSEDWLGQIFLSLGSTRYWTDDEIARHAADPFAMFRPAGF